ncbi:MAG: CDP-diacylglycerol--serine O-phosphatidyltransferase [Gammaproteobacteria bacterium]|nr:CDP-diacylglycerol--serine O-phosphatidyltransferase [Gammaproteobacteria bacterium]
MTEPITAESAAPPRRRGIYLLPNLLTTGCLGAGFFSIVAAINGKFSVAGAAVFVAMLFDGLDGRVARWTRTESAFGKEYDSLADMIAFGLAPALIVYQWGVARITEYGAAWGRFGWLASFFYAVCAALRLARFNARAAAVDKRFFEGLPSPSAAALVAAFVWFSSEWRTPGLVGLVVAFAVTVIAGALMVSSFAYPSLKQVDWDRRVKVAYLLLVPVFAVLIVEEPPTMLLAMFSTFVASAPVLWVWRRLTRRAPRWRPRR